MIKITNLIQLNNLEIKKFLAVVIFIQIAVLCIIGLDALNLHIPVIREILCFIYLTFIPGFLIIRLLELNKLENIPNILLTIGFSLAVLMFSGFILNLVSLIGFKPITIINVILTVTAVVLFLSWLCYNKNKDQSKIIDLNIELSSNEFLIVLLLILILFLSIFGPLMVNRFENDYIQLIYLILVTIFPIIALKWIPKKLFPLAVFLVSLSLMLHTSLISNYVWGSDVSTESNIANLVLNTRVWDMTIPQVYNSMLSISILTPIYSIFSGMAVQWVYKIIYPILFSFVPLGLYYFYNKQFKSKIAFLSCFLIIASFVFYNDMPALARQEIAEIFLTVILIIIVMDNIEKNKKYLFLTFFGIFMILSHYGLTLVILILMLLSLIIIKTPLHKIFNLNIELKYQLINKKIIAIFFVFILFAYTILSSAAISISASNIIVGVLVLITHILDPNLSSAVFIGTSKLPLFQSIERYFHVLTEVIILVGAMGLIRYKEKLSRFNFKLNPDYELLTVSSVILAFLSVFLPVLSFIFQAERLLHMLEFFLAPLFILGGIFIIEFLFKLVKSTSSIKKEKIFYMIAIYLSIFFIFNSALIYEVCGQEKMGSFAFSKDIDFPIMNDNEISAANWLNKNKNPDNTVFTDINKVSVLKSIVIIRNTTEFETAMMNNKNIFINSYIFIGTYNLKNDKLYVRKTWNKLEYIKMPDFNNESLIYNNNQSHILRNQ